MNFDDFPYSTFALFRNAKTADLQARFRQDLSASLAPILNEVITDQTRRFQQQLLLVASFLILLSLSLVELTGEAELSGVKIRLVGIAASKAIFPIALYLETLVAVRSSLDWSAWRIQAGAAEVYLNAARTASYGISSISNESELNTEEFSDSLSRDFYEGQPPSPEDLQKQVAVRQAQHRAAEDLEAKAAWMRSRVAPLYRTNVLRGAIEVFFPIAYGAGALILATWCLMQS